MSRKPLLIYWVYGSQNYVNTEADQNSTGGPIFSGANWSGRTKITEKIGPPGLVLGRTYFPVTGLWPLALWPYINWTFQYVTSTTTTCFVLYSCIYNTMAGIDLTMIGLHSIQSAVSFMKHSPCTVVDLLTLISS